MVMVNAEDSEITCLKDPKSDMKSDLNSFALEGERNAKFSTKK